MYLDNKFFGKGPNMFRKYCDSEKFYSGRKSCSTHPHNYYFQLIGETGIIGLAFLVYVYFLIIINLLRQFYNVYIKKKPYYEFHKLVLLALSFANFWPVITNGNLFGSFTSNMIILPICFYYAKPLVNQKNFINK
jgi:O-antigen ligase